MTLQHDSTIYYTGSDIFGTGNGTNVYVSAVSQPFNNNADWYTLDGTTPWLTPGGDATGPYATTFTNFGGYENGPVSFDVTSLVKDWYSGTVADYGVLLTADVGNGLHYDNLS